jgi:hypothetical protein
MFLATHSLPSTTSLSDTLNASATHGFDTIFLRAISGSASTLLDDFVAAATMCFFLLACFLVFLAVKLLLGVVLLSVAGNRYKSLKERERMWIHTGARRSSAFGTVTIEDETRGIIYGGNPEEERKVAEGIRIGREREMKTEMDGLETVTRYKMCAKRIW